MGKKHAANILFGRGTDLKDPKGLLEGTGKHMGHVKIITPEQAENPSSGALVKQASVLEARIASASAWGTSSIRRIKLKSVKRLEGR